MFLTTLRKYWRIFWKFRVLRLMVVMERRTDFFFWTSVSVMWTIFNFFFFSLIINASGNIAGWQTSEMYLLLSTFTILDSFTWSFFYANMRTYTNQVFTGELSLTLTKPIDTQFLISVQENSYNNIFRFVIGVGMLVWSLQQGNFHPTFWQLLMYVILLVVSLLFIYSLWFLISTCAFWVEKLDNINEIVPHGRRLWQVPRSVYTGIASTIFTVIVPLGLVSSIPSEILVNRFSLAWTLFYVGFTVMLFILSRMFFKVSIKKFSSVGN